MKIYKIDSYCVGWHLDDKDGCTVYIEPLVSPNQEWLGYGYQFNISTNSVSEISKGSWLDDRYTNTIIDYKSVISISESSKFAFYEPFHDNRELVIVIHMRIIEILQMFDFDLSVMNLPI